ncbi:hypothetical protein HYC85_005793 [Camellia sinensis]|uniref:pectinesterase n=1 Tax=Camellia sinensis TaxID=4442 RepID=A0A7J7I346_CAMSI|nr:hypothetical protein HYC85_005793 [Camellia sinensis]
MSCHMGMLTLILGSPCSTCVITGNGRTSYTHLGRPWGPFGRVVFAYTWMDACIKQVGWNNWDKAENERNACFYEYRYLIFSLPGKVNFVMDNSGSHAYARAHKNYQFLKLITQLYNLTPVHGLIIPCLIS